MAMLAGLKGVRSAEASQIATQIRALLATHIKTGLHLPSFLEAVGIDTLTAYAVKDVYPFVLEHLEVTQ